MNNFRIQTENIEKQWQAIAKERMLREDRHWKAITDYFDKKEKKFNDLGEQDEI